MPTPETLLKSVFGFDAFRPGQEEIVSAIQNGRDVLAIMPTGGGKSLCYQLPALARDGVTLVVSPLIALMRDQVAGLREAGVEAGALTSANTPEDNERIFDAIDRGALKLLYLAPERLSSSRQLLARLPISLLAIDEAHCVSQWGHDFRPDYLRIGELRAALGNIQTAAFTATADEETRAEILRRLFDHDDAALTDEGEDPGAPAVFLRGFDRPNLHLAFEAKASPRKQLMDFVIPRRGRSGIVYAGSRNKCEVLATALRAEGFDALPYHAGLDAETRAHTQDRFSREDGMVICATVAFGMGVDKPDIRFVAHADLPKSVEAYYQEIGRAGRDGAPADTFTLYGVEDIKLRRLQIDESLAPDERKRADHQRLNALLALAEAPGCRRQTLLAYFGEARPQPCGNCDLCRKPPELFDGAVAAQKALSAIYRTGERFGVEHVVDVLLGKTNERAERLGHDRLTVWGIGKEFDRNAWRGILRQLLALGLTQVDGQTGGWRLSEDARPVLRGEQGLQLRKDALTSRGSKKDERRPAPAALVDEADEPLLSALKVLRRRLAEAQNAPAYIVFNDRSLIDMATKKPRTMDELAQCHGVGAAKLARYGAEFLEVLTGAPAGDAHPGRIRAAASGDGELFDALHAAQLRLSRGVEGADKPLNCTNATLAKIVERRPDSLEALGQIPGMGPQKAERFGPAFLSILAAAAEA
ncbi:DNA helicase RecQ [Albimonas sp. CAU 1670]|uniref:DNA helicase RecQ n=1 Tax=Albimonas sp. CAU 1670 TaxID=3032599 RepID=UPI0023D97A28|nr:DNA helicase RecQ [Albimonas sp. CAU 1670]MDF2232818.1 DNA helicase RecQ [Albimonas sp. CAU 1670]